MRYVDAPAELGHPDAVILPGSKNTIQDLLWLRQSGLEAVILQHAARGGVVFGICGGYQMLGEEIRDPEGAERKGTVKGLGLLPVRTVFEQEKRRTRVHGKFLKLGGALAGMSGAAYEGYEIHMGRTEAVISDTDGQGAGLLTLTEDTGRPGDVKNAGNAGNLQSLVLTEPGTGMCTDVMYTGFSTTSRQRRDFLQPCLRGKGTVRIL